MKVGKRAPLGGGVGQEVSKLPRASPGPPPIPTFTHKTQNNLKTCHVRKTTMGDKKQCPICEQPMRTDLIVRHMLRHRKDIGCFMTNASIKWSIDNKSTIIYKSNPTHPFKSYGVCLICKEGRTQHSSMGDFQCWSKLHDKRNVCTKRWDEVAKYFISAYDSKEEVKEDVRSTESPSPVQPEPKALPPPTSPKLVVQNIIQEPKQRNQIHYEDSESEYSTQTTQTLEIWNRDNPTVQRVYDALSEILEQGMTYKIARCEYSELLEELEDHKTLIGDAWKALYDFIDDELSLDQLDTFLTSH